MATRYETGSREEVIREMVRCAVQDREALITAYAEMKGNAEAAEITAGCEAAIRDFSRLEKTLLGS